MKTLVALTYLNAVSNARPEATIPEPWSWVIVGAVIALGVFVFVVVPRN